MAIAVTRSLTESGKSKGEGNNFEMSTTCVPNLSTVWVVNRQVESRAGADVMVNGLA